MPIFKKAALFIFFILFSYCVFSQQTDTIKGIVAFNGSVSVTNNGFSLIPAFSLGDPAAIVILYAGGKGSALSQSFDIPSKEDHGRLFLSGGIN